MRAVDVLDLSHDLGERKHKETFLRQVNTAASGRRLRFEHHRLAQNRGILTNLIHRAVADYLQGRLGAAPLLCYPEGTLYLVEERGTVDWTVADDSALVRGVEDSLRGVQGRAVAQFVKKAQNGYKVDSAALESGATPQSIMAMIKERIEPQAFGEKFRWGEPARREQAVRGDLEAALPRLGEGERREVDRLLAESALLPGDDRLRVGELAQAYRNFLDAHLGTQLKARKVDAWQHVYRLLDLPAARWPIYEAVHGFRRAYFMARDTGVSLDELSGRIEGDLAALGAEEAATGAESFVGAYLADNLTLSFAPRMREDFAAATRRYSQNQHEQCCYCGSAFPTAAWMAANVPPSVGVQAFSNRLAGGGGEPKRRVCPVCRTQFILEKLGWASHRDKRGDGQTTFYLHLFPYSFFTEPFLDAWRREVQRLLSEEVSAFFIDTGLWLEEWRDKRVPDIHFKPTTVNGVALPRLAETVSNTPVMAINAPGTSYSAQFLTALQHAAILGRFFGCRLIMSRTAVPILPADGFEVLFVDGAPSALDWLVGGRRRGADDLAGEGVDRLIRRLSAIQALHRTLWDRRRERNLALELARAANDNPLALFFVADRAIAEKAEEPQHQLSLTLQCAPYLDQLMEEPMTQLQTLAQMAVDNNILGGTGPFGRRPRNALLKPFDIVFDELEQHPGAAPEDVHAAAAEEVFSHLQRIAEGEFKPGAVKEEKVGRYVRQLLDGVVGEMFGGDLNRFIADERFVRSAYLWYVRQALVARREERALEKDMAGAAPWSDGGPGVIDGRTQ